jgi:hypothetical protein
VSGTTLGSFPGYNFGSGNDVVAKLDAGGNLSWLRQFGTGQVDALQAITSDANGNFYVGGGTEGSFPGYSNPSHNTEAVAIKLDGSGNSIWVDQFQLSPQQTWVSAIAADGLGGVAIGGLTDAGIFIARLDASTGKQRWLKQFGPDKYLNDIAVDASGDVFVAGYITSSTETDASGIFILKLNGSDGSEEWMQQFQTQLAGQDVTFYGLAATPNGNVVAGGVVLGAHLVPVGQGADPSGTAILAELDGSTGNVVWLKQFGTGAGDEITSVAVDPQGNILAAGMTNGVFASGFQPKNDIFLLKFNAAGQNLWAQQIGLGPLAITNVVTHSTSVATDSSGNIFLGNVTQGAFPGASNPNNAVEMFVAKFGP